MKKLNLKTASFALAILFSMSFQSKGLAFTYAFQDFLGVKFGGSTVTMGTQFAMGYFTGSITVTGASLNLANFTNLNFTDPDVGFSTALDLGDPAVGSPAFTFVSVGTSPMDANTGGLKPAAGTQLYLIGQKGADFAFAISNPSWVVKTNAPLDIGGATFDWDSNATTPEVEGFSLSYATYFTPNIEFAVIGGENIISVIPEPATSSLFCLALGAALFGGRLLRKGV